MAPAPHSDVLVDTMAEPPPQKRQHNYFLILLYQHKRTSIFLDEEIKGNLYMCYYELRFVCNTILINIHVVTEMDH